MFSFLLSTYSFISVLGFLLCIYFSVTVLKNISLGIRAYVLPLVGWRKIDLVEEFGAWAVVTGSTDGIGLAYAKELAKRGVNIVLVSRTLDKLQKVSLEIEKEYSVKTKIICVDFNKGQSVFKEVEVGLQNVEVGILVNNAGVYLPYPMPAHEMSDDLINEIVTVNCGVVLHMTRIILPAMLQRRKGAIVNLASGAEMQPVPYISVYAASKVFIKHFTEAMSYEIRNSGIQVQLLSPFIVNTKLTKFGQHLHPTNLFVPNATMYARQAINTLGILDHTTGYWPHSLIYCGNQLLPTKLRMIIGAGIYKLMRSKYLSNSKQE